MSSNLAISLVIGASVGAAVSGLNQVQSSLSALRNQSLSISERLDKLSALSIAGVKSSVGSITALGGSITALAMPAMKFESAMADVKKVVDFKSPEGFKALSKDLLDLTDTIPMTAEELAAIAASGGQLGVAEQDLKSFTTTIAKMSVAFDMSAQESGDAMAKLANVYKIPISEIGKLGDAINDLSNSSPAKAADIVNTLGRIGGTAKQFGLTENAAASLSSAFISLGKTPEVAGTAINGMLTKLMTAEKGGKAFQASLQKMGLSAKKLKTMIAKNGEGAIVDFIKRVEKLPKDQAMGILVDIFGREYADDVAVLAGNVGLLEKSLYQLKETDENGNLRYLGSMEKEFAARAATTENALTTLKNSFTKLAISVGQYVLPVINDFVGWLQPIVIGISEWVNTNSDLMHSLVKWGSYIIGGITGFSALTGVLGGVVFIALKAFSTLNMLWSIISFSGKRLWGLSKILFSLTSFLGKLLLAGILKLAYGVGYSIGFIAKGLLSFGKLLSGLLLKGLMLTGKAILFIGRALMLNPIGLLITGIALAAYLIYRYWEPIKGFFSNLWQRLSDFFHSGIDNISTTILNWSPLGLFYQCFSAVLSWFGVDLPNQFTDFGKMLIDGFVNGISKAWNNAKEVVSNLGSGVKNWFAEKLGIHSPSRVFIGFGENTAQGLAIGINKSLGLVEKANTDMASAVSLSPDSHYQSLQTTFAQQSGQVQYGEMTIHFNPTININGSSNNQVLNEVKAGLNIGLREFEMMLARVLDQQKRRAF